MLIEIRVDCDRGPVAAEVVVEPGPRLVADDLVLHPLGLGQRVLGAHPVPQGAVERVDALGQSLRRDAVGGAVRLHPLGEGARSRQDGVHPAVRFAVGVGVRGLDPDVEVGRDLVDETDVVPGELAGRALERSEVRVEEARPFPP